MQSSRQTGNALQKVAAGLSAIGPASRASIASSTARRAVETTNPSDDIDCDIGSPRTIPGGSQGGSSPGSSNQPPSGGYGTPWPRRQAASIYLEIPTTPRPHRQQQGSHPRPSVAPPQERPLSQDYIRLPRRRYHLERQCHPLGFERSPRQYLPNLVEALPDTGSVTNLVSYQHLASYGPVSPTATPDLLCSIGGQFNPPWPRDPDRPRKDGIVATRRTRHIRSSRSDQLSQEASPTWTSRQPNQSRALYKKERLTCVHERYPGFGFTDHDPASARPPHLPRRTTRGEHQSGDGAETQHPRRPTNVPNVCRDPRCLLNSYSVTSVSNRHDTSPTCGRSEQQQSRLESTQAHEWRALFRKLYQDGDESEATLLSPNSTPRDQQRNPILSLAMELVEGQPWDVVDLDHDSDIGEISPSVTQQQRYQGKSGSFGQYCTPSSISAQSSGGRDGNEDATRYEYALDGVAT